MCPKSPIFLTPRSTHIRAHTHTHPHPHTRAHTHPQPHTHTHPHPHLPTHKQSLRGTVADKQGAFAGEVHDDEPRIDGDKAAFAGIDDHFRVAVNAVRVSDNLDPVVADVPLKLAAYRLAKDLVRASVACVGGGGGVLKG